MSVAAQSFLERGYAGTTMSGIAATLGGSKGTLWSYFSSKEELFAAVIDDKTRAYRVRLTEILEAPCDDIRQTLMRFCRSIVEKVTSPEAIALHRLVMAEAGRFPEMGRIFYERAPRQTHGLLAQFLEGAVARGQLRGDDDPMDMARVLVSLSLVGTQQKLLVALIERPTPEMVEADVNRAVTLFMRAYGG